MHLVRVEITLWQAEFEGSRWKIRVPRAPYLFPPRERSVNGSEDPGEPCEPDLCESEPGEREFRFELAKVDFEFAVWIVIANGTDKEEIASSRIPVSRSGKRFGAFESAVWHLLLKIRLKLNAYAPNPRFARAIKKGRGEPVPELLVSDCGGGGGPGVGGAHSGSGFRVDHDSLSIAPGGPGTSGGQGKTMTHRR